jgi:hypothetical protein
MSREEAIEKCVKAIRRQKGYGEHNWQNYPSSHELAKDVLAILEELGLVELG